MNNSAYIGFTRALAQLFDNAGIEYRTDRSTETGIVENAKWVDFQFVMRDGSSHKLYVPKNKGTVGKLHTTIEFSTQIEGVLELPSTERRPQYRNGLIRSHLSSADPERVAKLIIAALRGGAPVPMKRVAAPRQQPQRVANGPMPRNDEQPTAPSRDSESWTVSEEDIAEVGAELQQAGVVPQ